MNKLLSQNDNCYENYGIKTLNKTVYTMKASVTIIYMLCRSIIDKRQLNIYSYANACY